MVRMQRDPRQLSRVVRGALHALLMVCAGSCAERCKDPVSPNGATDRILWSAPVLGWVEGMPAVSPAVVYAAIDSGLIAVDRASGATRWFVRVTGMTGSRRMAVRAGKVFAAGVDIVRAHDAQTGAVLWERSFQPDTSSPAYAGVEADDAAIFVGLRDGRALALSQADGSTVWEAPIATAEWTFGGRIVGSTRSGDTIYVTAVRYLNDNAFLLTVVIAALDRATGRELWRYQYAGTDASAGYAATLVPGALVVTSFVQGYVIAVDRVTGAQRWRQQLHGGFLAPASARADTVFVATTAARAYALSASTGATLWTAELDAGALWAAPCGDELFLNDFHIEVRNAATGARVGFVLKASDTEVATSGIAVDGNVTYVGTNLRLLALRCD